MSDVVYEPVSIGDSCATKFQICRKLHDVMFPGKSEASFRLRITPPEFGRKYFGKDLFDWQGTPIDSVSMSLEADLKGLFEREDFEITPDALMNRRFNTNLIHFFETADFRGVVTEDLLEKYYAPVKAVYERMCDDFRLRLTEPGPFLYIHRCTRFPTTDQIHRLIGALSARSPDHEFHLLFVGYEEFDQDYSSLEGRVSKAYRTGNHGKPNSRWWEDNDAEWDAALAPFKLRPNPVLLAANPPPAAPPPPPPEPVSKGGLFARLLRRS